MLDSLDTILKPIGETPSLQDLAYHAIKSSILSLALPPGKQLSKSDLANSLKVSKTPVREALQRLEREGLVQIAPRKGVFVTEFSEREIDEISEIRSVLVGLACKRAFQNVNTAEFHEARKILEAGDIALQEGNREEWLTINERFHAWLMRLADSKQLSQVIEKLDEYFIRIQVVAASVPGDIIESNKEHYAILESMEKGDSVAASKAAADHIIQVGKQAVEFYKAFQGHNNG